MIYRKSVSSYIRKAIPGETIVTVIGGKPETRYVVDEDSDVSSYVVCGKVANEHYYVISEKKFHEQYDIASEKPILIIEDVEGDEDKDQQEGNDDNTATATATAESATTSAISKRRLERLRNEGFLEYRSKSIVYAHKVTPNDMKWFTCTTTTLSFK